MVWSQELGVRSGKKSTGSCSPHYLPLTTYYSYLLTAPTVTFQEFDPIHQS
jgi:hypothetical protein